MDWDEALKPKAKTGVTVGESLETLSVGELEARITALQGEIARVERELAVKRQRQAAADALFKK